MRRMTLAVALMGLAGLIWSTQLVRADKDDHRDKGHSEHTGVMSDQNFIVFAATRSAMERQLGTLAARKAANPAIREWGQRLSRGHARADQELLGIARQMNVQLPREMRKGDRDTLNRLFKAQGAAFDRDFVDTMVKAHKHALAVFQQEAKKAKDPALRQLAENTVPTLKQHLQFAERLAGNQSGHRGATEESSTNEHHNKSSTHHDNDKDHNK